MTIHIIKLCVGADSVDDLSRWQESRLRLSRAAGDGRLFHTTRMVPKRQDEVLDGGSLYWVIRGVIQVRQRIVGFDSGAKEDGTACCLFVLDPELVAVRPTPKRPFQGWRYLKPHEAPADLAPGEEACDVARMPARMRKELAELGLI